jgi:hypothetical protein
MKKETSLEWYSKRHLELLLKLENKSLSTGEYAVAHAELLICGLQLHKEEIMEANYDGQYLHAKSMTSRMMQDNAEVYYTEIYGG